LIKYVLSIGANAMVLKTNRIRISNTLKFVCVNTASLKQMETKKAH